MHDIIEDLIEQIVRWQWEASQRGCLSMWTIYDRPDDWPNGYMARRFEVGKAGPAPTKHTLALYDVEQLRDFFQRAGLVKLMRSEGDDPKIMETWV